MDNGTINEIWVDVGAHRGEKTFEKAQSDPGIMVYAFEPDPRVICERAGILSNFIAMPMAVTISNGVSRFYVGSDSATSSLFPFHEEGVKKWKGGGDLRTVEEVYVPTIRLDTFLDYMRIGRVDCLKVDAQGSDLDVLMSAGDRIRDVRKIVVEVYLTPLPVYEGGRNSRQVVVDFLTEQGFELKGAEKQTHGQEENLTFVNKGVVPGRSRHAFTEGWFSSSESRGTATFDEKGSMEINKARLDHLDRLGLELSGKTVLDAGCGVGHLAGYFAGKGCDVMCLDAREENITMLKKNYPRLNATVADVEKESMRAYGQFDIVFCYGLLYHLENPAAAIRNLARACGRTLLLETCVTDSRAPVMQLVRESGDNDQALSGIGCRPSESYVLMLLLSEGFSNIYLPSVRPEHRDYKYAARDDGSHWRDGSVMRRVIIASREPLSDVLLRDARDIYPEIYGFFT